VVTVEIDAQDSDRVVLQSGLVDLYLIEQLPGVRHDKKRSGNGLNVHTAPCTWATWMALQGVFYDQLPQMGPQLSAWLNREWTERVEPCLSLRGTTDVFRDPATPWDDQLFGFQRAGAAFLGLAKTALLGDEMGAGKTVTLIATVRRLAAYGIDVFPVCCIVPNSTKRPWKRHWEKWFPGVKVSVVGGSAAERRKALEVEADIYVIHWEAVRLHSRLSPYGSIRLKTCTDCDRKKGDPNLKTARCETHVKELNRIPFRTVIADEAHLMANPESKQTRAVWSVMHGKQVEYRYASTGTPIGNHPGNLWPIMHGLHPGEYPTNESFRVRYCLITWSFSGEMVVAGINPNTRTEFFGFFDSRFRRMPKALVLPQLPPMLFEARDCPMTKAQTTAYKQMEKHLMAEVNEGSELIVAKNNLAKNTRLLQFASATCELVFDGPEDKIGHVVMREPSPKIDEMLRVIEEAASPVVICAESRKLIDLASSRLDKEKILHHSLVGGLTDDVRDAMLTDFQQGRVPILLFTMKAGGTGLNMTAADKLIRMDRSWSMLINYQTINRFHRIGSEIHQACTVIDLVAPGTKEERQFTVLGQKMARLEEITRDKLTMRQAGQWAQVAALEQEEQNILNSTLLP
jgi:SNF2 family DNA or RNA helicase